MTNRAALTSVALIALSLTLACGKKEEPPTATAAPTPTGAPPMAAAPPAPEQAVRAPTTATAEAEGPSFEGEVDLRISSAKVDKAGKKVDPLLRLQVKGKKLRFALPEGFDGGGPQLDPKGYVVIDGRDKKVLAVSDEKRQVVLLPLDKLGEQMGKFGKDAPAEGAKGDAPKDAKKAPELKKTGKTYTVAGRSCEEWEIASEDGSKMLVCVASEQASWLDLPSLGLPGEHAWAGSLMDGQHLPLRAIAFDATGKEKGRMELVRLEAKPIDDAVFAPPAGYKVMDLGAMMRGMADMLGGGQPGADGQMHGSMPPGMAGKMPPNFQAMMARMRDQMQAMKAKQGAQGAPGATAERAARTEKLAAPADTADAPKAAAKAKTKAKTAEAKPRK